MNSDKKKRLIIPVATLMVAIVMMAGVGYAAITTSTFTVENNNIQGGELKVSVNDVTTKFFESKKIPYEVHTTNGTPLYKFDSSYDLVKDKVISIVDNTGLYEKYKIKAEVKSDQYDTNDASSLYSLNCKIVKADGSTVIDSMEISKTDVLKLSVTLDMNTGASVAGSDLTKFNLNDIKIIVTLTGVPPIVVNVR